MFVKLLCFFRVNDSVHQRLETSTVHNVGVLWRNAMLLPEIEDMCLMIALTASDVLKIPQVYFAGEMILIWDDFL